MSSSLAQCISIGVVYWPFEDCGSSGEHQETLRPQKLGAEMTCKQGSLEIHPIDIVVLFDNVVVFD